MIKIVEIGTKEVIGEVSTNHSLSFDDACRLAGLEWKSSPEVETDGWYKDGILYDESVAELNHHQPAPPVASLPAEEKR